MKKKIYTLPANEAWICDTLAREFFEGNQDICVPTPMLANVIWVLSDWCWTGLARAGLLDNKRVLTSVHHIVPTKFQKSEALDFIARDKFTHAYHVYNRHTLEQVKEIQENLKLSKKDVHLLPYWTNSKIWFPLENKQELRSKHNLPRNAFIISSFQRDTEGSSIATGEFLPKLEKGPDLFCDFVIAYASTHENVHVLLSGWRRQYVMKRLDFANISYTYIELPLQETINELYNCTDLYVVASRYEGAPQALLESSLCQVPTISTPVGIAEDVLPSNAISTNLLQCIPTIPVVPNNWKIPIGFEKYRTLLQSI